MALNRACVSELISVCIMYPYHPASNEQREFTKELTLYLEPKFEVCHAH